MERRKRGRTRQREWKKGRGQKRQEKGNDKKRENEEMRRWQKICFKIKRRNQEEDRRER